MSGIGGVFIKNTNPPHQAALDKICAALSFRGPDGHGVFTDKSVGLVHTRVNIDASTRGHQPMIDTKGRTLVFDGQIYNAAELRQSLQDIYHFKTKWDAEIILALYDAYGSDFTDHLRGMYAVALYDTNTDIIVLARDPFGIKPLYVTEMPSHMAFASEPKALIQSGYASDALDIRALRSVVIQHYMDAIETPYPSIQKLQPGEKIIYEHGTRISSSLRPAISNTPPRIEDEETALLHLEKTLIDSIDRHAGSNSSIGVSLSGETSSSTMMQVLSMLGERNNNVKAYTTYFDTALPNNERAITQAIAESTHTQLHEIPFGRQDFVALLPQIASYMDSPVADENILTTWKLATIAAPEQKFILCGNGGPELFGGHKHYRKRWWQNWYKPKPHTSHWSYIQQQQAKDMADHLPNNILTMLDSCMMAHGLENRMPFLDMAMSDFAFTLPDHLKLQHKSGQYLLKKWLDSKLPAAQLFRKEQKPVMPIGEWISVDAKNLSDIMVQHPLITELLTKADLDLLPKLMPTVKGAAQCWPLVYLALWHTGKQQNSYAPNIVETLAS